jgi:protein-L-isoaspartate O-methyltransferase
MVFLDSMTSLKNRAKRIQDSRAYFLWEERLRRFVLPGTQSTRAADYWAALKDCDDYYNDPMGKIRSAWVADQVTSRRIGSLLEVGSNSGRNLAAVLAAAPQTKLRGIDVNRMAIDYARKMNPAIHFEVADANRWNEGENTWDAILTMSLIDHIPDESFNRLAGNMVMTARKWIICVELWDGSDGLRGLYKYSRDLRPVFERLSVRTVLWEQSVGQYSTSQSLLWSYVGEIT